MAQKIIIDTDPGQDDALAILLALASPEIDVLGIVGAAGNVPLSLTSKNIRKICELAGRPDIKVFAGCDRPMTGPLVTAEHVHGATGMDGADLPEPSMPMQEQHGVDFIIDTLQNEPAGTVTVCTLGPLTNLGRALTRAPEIAGRIKQLVLMGGGLFEGGNITPAAEFNIYVDPPAAAVVFGSGVPIVMMPLDVTHKTLTTRVRVAAIQALGTPLSDAVVGWLHYFERFDVAKYGSDGGPLHDPNVIAYLLKPELYSGRFCNVEIETESELTKGMTVADWWDVSGRPKNALFMRDVDADGFYALLTERLSWLGRADTAAEAAPGLLVTSSRAR
ncbi:nucleoside hydrolase [Rhizobium leguminosarum]|nr:nucleoside hydrolase [Rhizobium leguminosarum]NKK55177.1 nucleoside hydrolase [Rhizobium leguminosarum bv. viciae]WSH67852.1 nucleoside hydrolase [Rhizobium ruizarguesonis]